MSRKPLARAFFTVLLLAGTVGMPLAPACRAQAQDLRRPDPARAREALEQAVEAYAKAQAGEEPAARVRGFARAQRAFSAAAAAGADSADLYADLGTAALQAEDLGTAVLSYRRALARDPWHGRALTNLSQARSLLPAWVPRPVERGWFDSVFGLPLRLPVRTRAAAAAGLFLVACVSMAVAIVRGTSAARVLAAMAAAGWLALLVSILWSGRAGRGREAVVVADDVLARAADSVHAPLRFRRPLPAGVEVRLLERREGWARVRFAGGREAWMQASALALVDDRP